MIQITRGRELLLSNSSQQAGGGKAVSSDPSRDFGGGQSVSPCVACLTSLDSLRKWMIDP